MAGAVEADFLTVAHDGSSGNQLWEARYNQLIGDDTGWSIAVSPDGARVFVTGTSAGTTPMGDVDYATVAYDSASGRELWRARYDGTQVGGHDIAVDIGISPDGSTVFVTGSSPGSGTREDYATIAYAAATGTQLWVARYDGRRDLDYARSLGISPDGTMVFVTGSTTFGGDDDYATVAYDADTGAQQWVAQYQGPGSGEDGANSLDVSPAGDVVFVTGSSEGVGTGFDYATVAYDARTGTVLWISRYNDPQNGNDHGSRLRVSPDGAALVVTGSSFPAGWGDYLTIAYEAVSGDAMWIRRYDGPASRDDQPSGLELSADGSGVFVTGESKGLRSGMDYATVAYDLSSGSQIWATRHNGAINGADGAVSIDSSPDGTRVFVTGHEATTGYSFDYATLAYDASSGLRLWLARYNGPVRREDHARDVAVSPDGSKVYVTGYSRGKGSGLDYATLAYAAH